MVNVDKERFFNRGGVIFLPDARAEEWREEYKRCDCNTCYDAECKARHQSIRFPLDVGGQAQCLRNESAKSNFVFRNGDGTVIVIPENVIGRICQKR